MVLVQMLKVIREQTPTDKVVLVSNYTEALDILGKASGTRRRVWTGAALCVCVYACVYVCVLVQLDKRERGF